MVNMMQQAAPGGSLMIPPHVLHRPVPSNVVQTTMLPVSRPLSPQPQRTALLSPQPQRTTLPSGFQRPAQVSVQAVRQAFSPMRTATSAVASRTGSPLPTSPLPGSPMPGSPMPTRRQPILPASQGPGSQPCQNLPTSAAHSSCSGSTAYGSCADFATQQADTRQRQMPQPRSLTPDNRNGITSLSIRENSFAPSASTSASLPCRFDGPSRVDGFRGTATPPAPISGGALLSTAEAVGGARGVASCVGARFRPPSVSTALSTDAHDADILWATRDPAALPPSPLVSRSPMSGSPESDRRSEVHNHYASSAAAGDRAGAPGFLPTGGASCGETSSLATPTGSGLLSLEKHVQQLSNLDEDLKLRFNSTCQQLFSTTSNGGSRMLREPTSTHAGVLGPGRQLPGTSPTASVAATPATSSACIAQSRPLGVPASAAMLTAALGGLPEPAPTDASAFSRSAGSSASGPSGEIPVASLPIQSRANVNVQSQRSEVDKVFTGNRLLAKPNASPHGDVSSQRIPVSNQLSAAISEIRRTALIFNPGQSWVSQPSATPPVQSVGEDVFSKASSRSEMWQSETGARLAREHADLPAKLAAAIHGSKDLPTATNATVEANAKHETSSAPSGVSAASPWRPRDVPRPALPAVPTLELAPSVQSAGPGKTAPVQLRDGRFAKPDPGAMPSGASASAIVDAGARQADISNTDEVGSKDFQRYSNDVAVKLSQGHDVVKQNILRFLGQGMALEDRLVVQSNFPAFEFRTCQDGQEDVERIELSMKLQRDGDIYLVSYQMTCGQTFATRSVASKVESQPGQQHIENPPTVTPANNTAADGASSSSVQACVESRRWSAPGVLEPEQGREQRRDTGLGGSLVQPWRAPGGIISAMVDSTAQRNRLGSFGLSAPVSVASSASAPAGGSSPKQSIPDELLHCSVAEKLSARSCGDASAAAGETSAAAGESAAAAEVSGDTATTIVAERIMVDDEFSSSTLQNMLGVTAGALTPKSMELWTRVSQERARLLGAVPRVATDPSSGSRRGSTASVAAEMAAAAVATWAQPASMPMRTTVFPEVTSSSPPGSIAPAEGHAPAQMDCDYGGPHLGEGSSVGGDSAGATTSSNITLHRSASTSPDCVRLRQELLRSQRTIEEERRVWEVERERLKAELLSVQAVTRQHEFAAAATAETVAFEQDASQSAAMASTIDTPEIPNPESTHPEQDAVLEQSVFVVSPPLEAPASFGGSEEGPYTPDWAVREMPAASGSLWTTPVVDGHSAEVPDHCEPMSLQQQQSQAMQQSDVPQRAQQQPPKHCERACVEYDKMDELMPLPADELPVFGGPSMNSTVVSTSGASAFAGLIANPPVSAPVVGGGTGGDVAAGQGSDQASNAQATAPEFEQLKRNIRAAMQAMIQLETGKEFEDGGESRGATVDADVAVDGLGCDSAAAALGTNVLEGRAAAGGGDTTEACLGQFDAAVPAGRTEPASEPIPSAYFPVAASTNGAERGHSIVEGMTVEGVSAEGGRGFEDLPDTSHCVSGEPASYDQSAQPAAPTVAAQEFCPAVAAPTEYQNAPAPSRTVSAAALAEVVTATPISASFLARVANGPDAAVGAAVQPGLLREESRQLVKDELEKLRDWYRSLNTSPLGLRHGPGRDAP